jgi:predicted ThiF/HesA family dinucleotide-utilizing enzyme
MKEDVKVLEELLKSFGSVLLLGAGRLGFRVFERLYQVQRGGFKKIVVYDGGRIDSRDVYHILKGAYIGEKKVDFLKRVFPIDRNYRILDCVGKYFNKDDISAIENYSVIISTIAGGDTLELVSKIAEFASKKSIPVITTNGVFGFGDEDVKVCKLEEAKEGPALFLQKMVSDKNIFVVGTGKFIRNGLPITPVILDKIADIISVLSLKLLYRREK